MTTSNNNNNNTNRRAAIEKQPLTLASSSSSSSCDERQEKIKLFSHRLTFRNMLKLIILILIAVPVIYKIVGQVMAHSTYLMNPISLMDRECPRPSYETLAADKKPKICMTTLTDAQTKTTYQKTVRFRNFDNILGLTWDNMKAYAEKHDYKLVDSSSLVDKHRPASWSKILAVQDLLSSQEECDWVMWVDADVLFMNSNKAIEDFLPTEDSTKDFIVAVDFPNPGYNAGVWLIRNSNWSRDFLQQWWDMETFVKMEGLSKSGDNDALKHFLMKKMPTEEFDKHVLVPPRCTMNSFSKFLLRPIASDDELSSQPYYMSENYYHKGDLLVHIAGYDNKAGAIELMKEYAI